MTGVISMKNKEGRDAGQSLLEFALVLPILLLILVGILNFGEILTATSMVQQVNRDAARYASVGHTNVVSYTDDELNSDDYLKLVKCKTGSSCPTPNPAVSVTPSPGSNGWASGTQITLNIDFYLSLWAPIVSFVLGNPYHIHTSVTMLAE